jgi:hypothetical protein
LFGRLQERADLLVGRLLEVRVPAADRDEWLGGRRANDLVRFRRQLTAGTAYLACAGKQLAGARLEEKENPERKPRRGRVGTRRTSMDLVNLRAAVAGVDDEITGFSPRPAMPSVAANPSYRATVM